MLDSTGALGPMLLTADKMFFNGPYGNGDELGTAQFMVNMMISIDGIYRSTSFNGETQVCLPALLPTGDGGCVARGAWVGGPRVVVGCDGSVAGDGGEWSMLLAVAVRWLGRGCAVAGPWLCGERWLCRGCTVTVSWDTALPWLGASLAAGRALNAGCGRVPDRRGQPRPG